MKSMISLILSGVVILYLVGWAVHLRHFHSKFKQCNSGWEAANASGDYAERWVFYRATCLAHNDTAMAPFWPLVGSRWNTDYVAEARRLEQRQ